VDRTQGRNEYLAIANLQPQIATMVATSVFIFAGLSFRAKLQDMRAIN